FGGADDLATTIAIQSDGKVVVGGFTDSGLNIDFALTRFNNNGTPDNTFDSDGKTATDFGSPNDIAYSVALQSDGKIVLAGCSIDGTSGYDFALARYNSNGSPDMSFDSDGKLITVFGLDDDYACSVAIQSDNKIVVAGMSFDGSLFDFAVARYDYVLTETDFIYEKTELEIYPNPSNGIFNLKNVPEGATIYVYDVVGNCLWNKECSKNVGRTFIDMSSYAKGVYFLEMKKDGKQIVKKLVLR
ncbi:MAG TPA: T9SS type A sorting domain-containing protein, partial [Bacteroidia bacterium]|nr:T9SS type A sorting domain-containing protein [Bacteroidia bacterium]